MINKLEKRTQERESSNAKKIQHIYLPQDW